MKRSLATRTAGVVLCAAFQGCATPPPPAQIVKVDVCDRVCEATQLMATLAQSRRIDGQPDRSIMAAGLATYLTARPDLKSAIRKVLQGQDIKVTETGDRACAWTKDANGEDIAECARVVNKVGAAPQ